MSEPWPPGLARALDEARADLANAAATGAEAAALDALWTRIDHRVTIGAGPSVTGPRWLLLGVTGTVALLAGLGVGYALLSRPRPAAPPAPVVAAARVAAPPAAETVAAGRDAGPASPDAAATPAPVARPPAPRPTPAEPAPPPQPAAPSATLGPQLRLYERAEAARADGRRQAAQKAFGHYLATYPQGALATDARLNLAELAVEAGDRTAAATHLWAVDWPSLPAGLRHRYRALADLLRAAPDGG